MDFSSFDRMSRDDLVARARALGVERPELMTRVELADEIVRRNEPDPTAQRRARGWLGVARDLVASVVESGLHLPDAAALIRGERAEIELKGGSPVATVTLAEIYATQGHIERALGMLDEVLASEPDHPAALKLRERLARLPRRRGAAPPPIDDALAADTPPPSTDRAPAIIEAQDAESEFEPEPEPDLEPEIRSETEIEPERAAESEIQAELAPDPASAPLVEPPLGAVPEPEPTPVPEATPAFAPVPVLAEPEITPPARVDGLHGDSSVVLLRTPSPHPIVCWDVGASPTATRFELRCLGFTPTATGVERRELSLPITTERGRHVLDAFQAHSVVRVALGLRSEQEFAPLAIATELVVSHGELGVRFRPPLARAEPITQRERALAAEFAE